jgi:segregation and condensation protein A
VNKFLYKTEKFEGPIELLLDLVEKRKLHVSDVSLAKVTDEFMKVIDSYESIPLAETTQFVYVASLLLLIKSKGLLPTLDLSTEETASIDELKRRLTLYGIIKEGSQGLGQIFGKHLAYAREEATQAAVVFAPGNISGDLLNTAISDILARAPKEEKLDGATVKKVISLEEAIGNLAERISKSMKITFSSYKKLDRAERLETVVSFLAMLELVRRGSVYVIQRANFGDIEIESSEIGTPRYV